MRLRPTARVLLLDMHDRLLLLKGRWAHAPEAPGEWFTVGGGIEPGETLQDAAAREIREETGFTDAILGDVVWRRDAYLGPPGEAPRLFQEQYIVARCHGGEPSRAGWDAGEQALVDDIAWWTMGELLTTAETVHPVGLAGWLPDILAGLRPDPPLILPWR